VKDKITQPNHVLHAEPWNITGKFKPIEKMACDINMLWSVDLKIERKKSVNDLFVKVRK